MRALLFKRVLRRNHKKRLGQGSGLAFNRDLTLFHGFEQGALCLGAGTVDLIGEQYLGKERAGVEFKLRAVTIKNRDTQQVAGHQVAGELHALELQPEGTG